MAKLTISVGKICKHKDDEVQPRLSTGMNETRWRKEENEREGKQQRREDNLINKKRRRMKFDFKMTKREQISVTTTTGIIRNRSRTFEALSNSLLILIMLTQLYVACLASEKSRENVEGE